MSDQPYYADIIKLDISKKPVKSNTDEDDTDGVKQIRRNIANWNKRKAIVDRIKEQNNSRVKGGLK
jgi:hypothetical protein